MRRRGLGIHGAELGLLLPIQLRLHRGEQLVEQVAAGLPGVVAAVAQPMRLEGGEVSPREAERSLDQGLVVSVPSKESSGPMTMDATQVG